MLEIQPVIGLSSQLIKKERDFRRSHSSDMTEEKKNFFFFWTLRKSALSTSVDQTAQL